MREENENELIEMMRWIKASTLNQEETLKKIASWVQLFGVLTILSLLIATCSALGL